MVLLLMLKRNCSNAVWLFCRICQSFLIFSFRFRSFFFLFPDEAMTTDEPQPAATASLRFDCHYPTTRASGQASLRDTPFNHYQITSTYYSHM